MAIGVVKTCDDELREEVNDVLILRYISHLKMDCLELAVWCECKEFVAMSTVQRVLDKLWKGDGCNSELVSCYALIGKLLIFY